MLYIFISLIILFYILFLTLYSTISLYLSVTEKFNIRKLKGNVNYEDEARDFAELKSKGMFQWYLLCNLDSPEYLGREMIRIIWKL